MDESAYLTKSRTPGSEPGSAVALKLRQRKFKRYAHLVFLAVIAGPVLLVLCAMAIFWGGSGSGWALLGIPFIMLGALLAMALPLLVPAIFIFAAWFLIRSYYRKPPIPTAAAAASTAVAPVVEPDRFATEIALLETLRRRLAAEARRRTWIYVPLGLAAALALFLLMTQGGGKTKGSPAVAFIVLMVIGGGGAWIYAVGIPGARYALAFKTQLLSRLLAAHGDLRHSIGAKPDTARAVACGFLPSHDEIEADDVLEGVYRQRPIRITELSLTRKGNKSDIGVFQGLLVEVSVSTPFKGITMLTDREAGEPGGALRRVRLEDTRFDEIYATYATDQIEGRAVLTPAVMERLLAMADGRSFLPPHFLLDGTRMSFALASFTPGSLFEPPGLETHVATQQLASLEADLATVFALADAMIDMHIALRAPQSRTDAGPHDAPTGRPTR